MCMDYRTYQKCVREKNLLHEKKKKRNGVHIKKKRNEKLLLK